MTRKALVWTLVFLPLSVAAIAMEFWAGLDHDPDTVPWTVYITRYVPWPVALLVFVVLFLWLPPHFVRYYRYKRAAEVAGVKAAMQRHPAGKRRGYPYQGRRSGIEPVRMPPPPPPPVGPGREVLPSAERPERVMPPAPPQRRPED